MKYNLQFDFRRSFQPPIPSPLAEERKKPVGLPTPTLQYEIGSGDAPVVSIGLKYKISQK